MHHTLHNSNSWAAGPSPREDASTRPALRDQLQAFDREAPAASASAASDPEDLPETHVTMDTLLGTSHYVEPSPHRLVKARRTQVPSSSSQPSLSSNSNHRHTATTTTTTTTANKRYPFTHKVGRSSSARHTRPSSSSSAASSRRRRNSANSRRRGTSGSASFHPGRGPGRAHTALHIMAPTADTPPVARDAGKSLWREWVDGQKLEAITYDSIALNLESRMARAAVLSRRHGRVNSLRTAVAFDCLDQLGDVFGRYGSVFRTIRAELEQSIYVDGRISSRDEAEDMKRKTTRLMDMASAAAERNEARHRPFHDERGGSDDGAHTTAATQDHEGEDEEEDPEVLYGQRQTYFEQSSMLEVERKRILDMASHLQATLEEWEANKVHEQRRFQAESSLEGEGGSAAAHVWAEILQKGRHEKQVATLLSKVAFVHSHFKGKVDEDLAADEPAGGPQKVVSAFKHLRIAEQVAFMNEIISDQHVSQHLLKKNFEACLQRLSAKRICRSVAVELSKPARVHNKDRKMKVKSQDVQRMFAQVAPLLSHEAKTTLQMQILHSLADEDRAAKKKNKKNKKNKSGKNESGLEHGETTAQMLPRVLSVYQQTELLGDAELDALFTSLNAVPLQVAENAATEADALRQRLTACRAALEAATHSLQKQTQVLNKYSSMLVPQESVLAGAQKPNTRAPLFDLHHGKEEDVGHTSSVLLAWLHDVTRSRRTAATVTMGAASTTTLWGGMQDGQLLAGVAFTILLSRAKAADAAARGDPTARAPPGKCWSTATVLKWKSGVDAEQGGAMALLRDHVFPALCDARGLGVPKTLASAALVYQSNPDAAMTLATFLYCKFADTDLSASLEAATPPSAHQTQDTAPALDPAENPNEKGLSDGAYDSDVVSDGESIDNTARALVRAEKQLVNAGNSAAARAIQATQSYLDAQTAKQAITSAILAQCLAHEPVHIESEYDRAHRESAEGGGAAGAAASPEGSSDTSVAGDSSSRRQEHEIGSGGGGSGGGGGGASTMAHFHEAQRIKKLFHVDKAVIGQLRSKTTEERAEGKATFQHRTEICARNINLELASSSQILSQVFRHYSARSQETSGAGRLARKDFVRLIKDSNLIGAAVKVANVVEAGSVKEAAAATKINAIARGKRDRNKTTKMKASPAASASADAKGPSGGGSTSSPKMKKKKTKRKKNETNTNTPVVCASEQKRDALLANMHFGRRHAEKVFDDVLGGDGSTPATPSSRDAGNKRLKQTKHQVHSTIDIGQFSEALVRFANVRFAGTTDDAGKGGARVGLGAGKDGDDEGYDAAGGLGVPRTLTLFERVCRLVQAVCRFARRSDVHYFRSQVMWQAPVQKVLERYQQDIQLAFKECTNATARAGTENRSAKDTETGKSAKGGRSGGGGGEPVTTLREFELWLETKKKTIKKKRPGSAGGSGRAESSGAVVARGGKLTNVGKRTAREIFALVQQLDWADGSISDDTEMTLDEFREALVALTLHIDPSPFRAMDQRVEGGLGVMLF